MLIETAEAAEAAKYFVAGGVCACVSHTGSVPLDVVKTRLQTEPGRDQGSAWRCAQRVLREDGPAGLLVGAGPTFLGYAVQGSLKYGLYEVFKRAAAATAGASLPLVITQLSAAAAAELVGSAALCPLEATRIRVVADDRFAAAGFRGALWMLVEEAGVAGLFASLPAIYAKQIPYTMLQLASYEQVGGAFRAAGVAPPAAALGAALVAGVVATLASQPGDTLLSRLNATAREGSGDGALAEVLAEAAALVDEAGVAGLFTGLQARLFHTGSIVVVQLLVNDAVKAALGIGAADAAR